MKTTIIASPLPRIFPDLLVCRAASGSHPWYVVPYTGHDTDRSITRAEWIQTRHFTITTGDASSPVRTTDGRVRFFARKTDLLRAVEAQ